MFMTNYKGGFIIATQLSPVEKRKNYYKLKNDPVLWAKTFVRVSDPITKKDRSLDC